MVTRPSLFRKKYIFCARDVGSGTHILAAASSLRALGADVQLLLQDPCSELAKKLGVKFQRASDFINNETPLHKLHLRDIQNLFRSFEPECVVCGLSGFHSNGIDEAVMVAAHQIGIPCFAMQDFWGDTKIVNGIGPTDYLVIDQTARRLTQQLTSKPCHIVGSLKHADLATFDYHAARRQFRRSHGILKDDILVCLFGQALQSLNGYTAMLRDLGNILEQEPNFKLIYKPHPLETASHIRQTLSFFTSQGWSEPPVVKGEPAYILSGSDIALSWFSTIGLDAAYLFRVKKTGPLIVYADYPAEISNYWRRESGLDFLPPVNDGYAFIAHDQRTLRDCFYQAKNPHIYKKIYKRIDEVLPDPQLAIGKLIEILA